MIKRLYSLKDEIGNKFSEYPNPSHPNGIIFNGEISTSAKTEIVNFQKINPNYNKNSEYIPRSGRKEWAPIGLIGKLRVRTAEPISGNSIDSNSQGFAINGTKYRVLNTIRQHTDNQYGIVRVFFK